MPISSLNEAFLASRVVNCEQHRPGCLSKKLGER
jgi:hypothetical protein